MGLFALISSVGEVSRLSFRVIREAFRWPFEFRLTMEQLSKGGVDSWSITVLTALFTGMVVAAQFAIGLQPFGASMYTGNLVALGVVRELGPVLTALLVGGRVGAGFTAELGTMAVTEQIDAIRCLGADPVRKLVLPRVVAMTFILPLLTLLADVVACFGGGMISVFSVGVTPSYALQQMVDSIGVHDLMHGLMKAAVFGYIISIISCWVGITTRGGAESVGVSTTNTVVYTSVAILVSDFFLTQLFLSVYG